MTHILFDITSNKSAFGRCQITQLLHNSMRMIVVASVILTIIITFSHTAHAGDKKRFYQINRNSVQLSIRLDDQQAARHTPSFLALNNKTTGRMRALQRDRLQRTAISKPSYRVAALPRVSNGVAIHSDNSNSAPIWPIPEHISQRISSPFGYRIHPVTGKRKMHQGVDIAVKKGTPVRATHSGLVEKVTTHRYLGRYIKVRHSNNEYSLYGHLSTWDVAQGDFVNAGDVIGKVGSTGRSTGPHLDYSLRINNKPVNPMRYLVAPESLRHMKLSQR